MSQEQVATQQIRSSDWAQIIQNRNSSGLTISEYCSQMGISETAYYYWLRKLRRAALSSGGIELVEIKEPSSPVLPCAQPQSGGFSAEATISVGTLSISVNSNTPRELIRTLMEVAARAK